MFPLAPRPKSKEPGHVPARGIGKHGSAPRALTAQPPPPLRAAGTGRCRAPARLRHGPERLGTAPARRSLQGLQPCSGTAAPPAPPRDGAAAPGRSRPPLRAPSDPAAPVPPCRARRSRCAALCPTRSRARPRRRWPPRGAAGAAARPGAARRSSRSAGIHRDPEPGSARPARNRPGPRAPPIAARPRRT